MNDQPRRATSEEPAGADERRRAERAAAAARMQHQGSWVDLQLRRAIERGDFENLPGYGKPLDLGDQHDPEWWVKRLIEREQVTGVVPPSLQLRREDAELDGRLDRLPTEAEVRQEVVEFNDRVRWALYRPPEGPPVVTRRRDADLEVQRWRERRAARRAALPAGAPTPPETRSRARRGSGDRTRWWRRGDFRT